MLGEELNSSHATERRLVGDCTYAVVDQNTGKVMASAKNPGKWGRVFDFRSVFGDPPQAAGNIPPPPVPGSQHHPKLFKIKVAGCIRPCPLSSILNLL
jgi:hypothetical protein